MTNALAAVARKKGSSLTIEEVRLGEPRADEILVRIVASGVCHTDMVVRDQGYAVPLPLVLGHEGSGVVDAVGSAVTQLQVGDHVALSYAFCGKCAKCTSGQPFYCVEFYDQNFKGARMDGTTPVCDCHDHPIGANFFAQSSFATYAIATERNAVKVPKDVPLELMGPLGCGIQTGAGAVLNCLKPKPEASVAVFGAGAVGLAAVMAARVSRCEKIIVVDLNPSRLALAKELGATHTVNPREDDTVKEIRAITNGGVDYSLECTSVPKVFRQAVDSLGIPGTCGLIGSTAIGTEATIDIGNFLFGRTACGIVEGQSIPSRFIPELIDLWKRGEFPFDRLVKFYRLEEINQAMEDSEKGRVIKPILKMRE
jgi:aryl-alcohol dehydrogenase